MSYDLPYSIFSRSKSYNALAVVGTIQFFMISIAITTVHWNTAISIKIFGVSLWTALPFCIPATGGRIISPISVLTAVIRIRITRINSRLIWKTCFIVTNDGWSVFGIRRNISVYLTKEWIIKLVARIGV